MGKFLLINHPNQNGFTLLEIMIALAILAITMTALLMSSSQVSKNSRYLRDKTFASIVASNILTKSRAKLLAANTLSGIEKQGTKTYQWDLQIQPLNKQLDKLIVSVRLPKHSEPLIEMSSTRVKSI